ncbi:MAG: hypothetical protein QOH12_2370 [Solirubrobacteraceae bacterium]|jgi:hypothetical protein|nr:hypothetical protein [Solirubrobacteraceae bacterium]
MTSRGAEGHHFLPDRTRPPDGIGEATGKPSDPSSPRAVVICGALRK